MIIALATDVHFFFRFVLSVGLSILHVSIVCACILVSDVDFFILDFFNCSFSFSHFDYFGVKKKYETNVRRAL